MSCPCWSAQDYDGYAFYSVNLTGGELQRLASLSERLS
jgi:hypothetical protein